MGDVVAVEATRGGPVHHPCRVLGRIEVPWGGAVDMWRSAIISALCRVTAILSTNC